MFLLSTPIAAAFVIGTYRHINMLCAGQLRAQVNKNLAFLCMHVVVVTYLVILGAQVLNGCGMVRTS